MDFFSIVKRLRLGPALLAAAAPFCRPSPLMPEDEARRVLEAFFPRKRETALCVPPRTWPAPSCEISVIIPAYQNGPLIGQTVRSVLAQQTSFRFEALVINDGSTDETAQVLASFDDPRLRVITQENRGVSEARNAGMEAASGAYLCFLDGDDILLPGALETLMQCAVRHDADLVQGGYSLLCEDGSLRETHPEAAGRLDAGQVNGFVWGRLLRRERMAGLRFPGRVCYEDSIMAQLIVPLFVQEGAELWGVSEPVLGYRYNPSGFSQTFRSQAKCVDTVWITDILRADRAALGLRDTQTDYEHLLDMAMLSCRRMSGLPKEVRRAAFAVYRQIVSSAGTDKSTTKPRQRMAEQAIREGNEKRFSLLAHLG